MQYLTQCLQILKENRKPGKCVYKQTTSKHQDNDSKKDIPQPKRQKLTPADSDSLETEQSNLWISEDFDRKHITRISPVSVQDLLELYIHDGKIHHGSSVDTEDKALEFQGDMTQALAHCATQPDVVALIADKLNALVLDNTCT